MPKTKFTPSSFEIKAILMRHQPGIFYMKAARIRIDTKRPPGMPRPYKRAHYVGGAWHGVRCRIKNRT